MWLWLDGWMKNEVTWSRLRSEGPPALPRIKLAAAQDQSFALGRFQKITDLVRGPLPAHAPRPVDWLE
jgi:hypothetical protein